MLKKSHSFDGRYRAMVIRMASENDCRDSSHYCSLVVTSPLKTQKLVLIDPVFVVLPFDSRDWHSFE